MPLSIPPELKKITQFIRRAEELDRDKSSPESRVVAFYCRQHAVQVGIPLASSPAGKKCLGDMLNDLEGEKKAMSVFTRDESKLICRKFADKVFEKADTEDRAGAAGKGTAKTFYAAASFYEILTQFYDPNADELEKGPEQEEEERKRVYSKWKATEILKAIKEGREPTPGGYGESPEGDDDDGAAEGDGGGTGVGDEPSLVLPGPSPEQDGMEKGTEVDLYGPPPDYSLSKLMGGGKGDGITEGGGGDEDIFVPGQNAEINKPTDSGTDFRPPMTPVYQPPVPSPPRPPAPSPPAPAPAPATSILDDAASMFGFGGASTTSSSVNGKRVSKQALEDAVELTKFGLAALQSKDVDLGAERLRQALAALGR